MLIPACIIIGVYAHFDHMLNQNVLDKAEKCKATDLSSLNAVLRRIVDMAKGIDQHFPSLAFIPGCVDTVRLLQKLVERYGPRHSSLRFCRLLMLHNIVFPQVIKTVKVLTTIASNCGRKGLFQFTDFEPEETHHGSGFLIANNFVITNNHVIEEAMSDETLKIRIVNKTIGELPCVVVHCDAAETHEGLNNPS